MRRLGIYPGSFDPPTWGHLDVIERASNLFDRVIVAVGRNSSKSPLFTDQERIESLRQACQHLSNIEVESFEGLLVEYARERGAKALIRGLRATSDFDYEFQIAMVNRRLQHEIETIFLMTKWEHSYLSSSIVREVAQLEGDYRQFVPPAVAEMIAQKLAANSQK
ncbi:MAG TPA: pantetheine-phosphate adenylyltransferase [Fimbriimonadaceae bacterium]|nr:pantetheine-phosphate adenylyltransferase [Fimbriimonadaceae bacterium]HRJ32963.1 pantetheine-phosphate adenylyltransferase [Fimbriimonadaceae bacterium]